jgi:hypothetical protein
MLNPSWDDASQICQFLTLFFQQTNPHLYPGWINIHTEILFPGSQVLTSILVRLTWLHKFIYSRAAKSSTLHGE